MITLQQYINAKKLSDGFKKNKILTIHNSQNQITLAIPLQKKITK